MLKAVLVIRVPKKLDILTSVSAEGKTTISDIKQCCIDTYFSILMGGLNLNVMRSPGFGKSPQKNVSPM